MAQAKLKVTLLDTTTNAGALIYSACRQCYSAHSAAEIFRNKKESRKQQEEFIRKVVASGHESPLEHVKFTFAVEGVSRALTHQLVRHRIASYSQQSQRYVKETDFDFIIPPSIEKDMMMKTEFLRMMKEIQESYTRMLECFKQKGKTGEKANEDARFLLPQAAETKIVVTMNCRELLHFFRVRCCSRAQWEIRKLADVMLAICKKQLPCVFDNAGAKCVSLEFCPEGEKFSCGRYPIKEKIE
ncbi:MAG: FAD-dependent thymidylate synthase [Candidatus Omnitrophica bacterium]|nr:FAD-dependent thymidylate synthase [Candidatus Omnitrophota bacterium]MCG2703569.1 FAD-dependent thymidylate synthase [Candidatus Omnitrophota bacterium]